MFSKKKENEIEMNVMLDEPLTDESCIKIVMELIKYLLYQKQQIPFPFEALTQYQKGIKETHRNAISFKTLSNTLKNVSDQLSSQFFLKGCDIREIAVLLGATILSPRLCIRIELPSYILNSKHHREYKHPPRKPLLKLMRSILECDKFQEEMSVPLNITNMFVMLKKHDSNSVSEYFLPKQQYEPPAQTRSCFNIRLCQGDETDIQCNCRTLVKVYHESCKTQLTDENDVQYSQHNSSTQSLYQWYQSKLIIKGFKFYS